MPLDAQIEAVLFFKAEPVSAKQLCAIFSKTEEEIRAAIATLEEKLRDRGMRVLQFEDLFTLGTAAKASELIEKLTREELSRDLGKAGLETISIVLYQGPISRREIDYIRGVNSTFILRNLLIRGLVEKVANPKDERSFLYQPTLELLSHLGVEKIEQLPEYESVRTKIAEFKGSQAAQGGEAAPIALENDESSANG